jgi:hypothetical protein
MTKQNTSHMMIKKKYAIKKHKTTSLPPTKILFLSEVEIDLIYPRKEIDFKIAMNHKYQIKLARNGAIYQNHFGDSFLFRPENPISELDSPSHVMFSAGEFPSPFHTQNSQTRQLDESFPDALRQISVVWNLMRKRSFSGLIRVIKYRFKTFSRKQKLFFAMVMLLLSKIPLSLLASKISFFLKIWACRY